MSKFMLAAMAGALPFVALLSTATAAHATGTDPVIRTEPVQGVCNQSWCNCVADINEADKERTSDLKRSTGREDHADADKDYVKDMRDRGYRVARVTVLAYNDRGLPPADPATLAGGP